ncbi:signal recognition particle protein [Polymorphobacter multimanifer]|uniref:Signal recognition particle protein n=1 Tax=Polymorphobacter multimanifer TaxID=1070431 RepID=A0A841L445_9SPHN|nr:signal recognition particle protein [Polymorphobacter multimanifer]MBB6227414.1 signal recognition particle subunit SRP54 [Polymorphobacter multimanifer]GGI79155.1 signal recognition particle protein [Polymorphobacter multimanifer]
MFDSLADRLGSVFEKLRGRGALTELDVRAAMREVRIALLEADVALPVVKDFVEQATERAIGAEVIRSVTPGQQVVKIVNDCLVELLGSEHEGLNIPATPPAVLMMVGLQGSGKTTSTAKLAKFLTERQGKKVLMASLDVARPAAQEQLRVLGEQTGVATLPIIAGQSPVTIAERARQSAKLQGFDVVLLDTAGRLSVDAALMAEMAQIANATQPHEILLVVDALTGQDAVSTATLFKAEVPLTGVILTRMDGDARGGAALSMRAITGKPIKFAGTGEKLDALEAFDPQRVAGRILGMGDIVGLVERAAANVEQADAERMAEKLSKGQFDLDDLRAQLKQMKAMGGLGALASMMPGVAQAKQAMASGAVDEKLLGRMEAVISSMTPKERSKPEIITAKRKIRIAKGSGTTVMEVNRVLKMQLEMATAMKKLRKMGGMKGMAAMLGRMGNSPGGVMGGLGGLLGGPGGPMGGPGNKFKR